METSQEYNPTYLSGLGTGTSTIFSGRGTLGNIVVGTTAAGTITIKDGTTTIGVLKASIVEGTYWFNSKIANSLVITTAASPTITVNWRQ